MLFNIKKKSVFYKYLVSYFIIFLIPLITMSAVLYKNSVVNLQKEIESSNMAKLSQVKDVLDTRLKEMEQIAMNISDDTMIIPYMMRNYSMKAKEGIEQLARYKSNNIFSDELLLYFRDDDTIYASSGQSSLDTLVKSLYQFSEAKEQQLLKDINTLKVSTLSPVEKVNINSNEQTEMITYMVPIPKTTSIPTATVLFLIRKANFDRMIKDTLGSFKGAVYIRDKDNNILVSVNNEGFVSTDLMTQNVKTFNSSGVTQFRLDKKAYSLVNLKSDDSEMIFTTLMPTDQFFRKVVEMRTLIFEIILVLVVFGIGLAISMSINNFRPIWKLSESLRLQWTSDDKTTGKNEIENISNSINLAIHQNKDMAAQISSQMPLIREQVLTMLLKGGIQDKKEMEGLLVSSQIQIDGPYYSVVVLSWKDLTMNMDTLNTKEEFLEKIHLQLTQSQNAYVLELLNEDSIALILNISDETKAKAEQIFFAQKVQEAFFEYFGNTTAIGIGKVYNELTYINRSFIEALAAIEYKLLKGNRNIVFFEEIMQSQKQVYWYPVEEQMRFTQSLKQGDCVVALENLKAMMSKITEKETSLLMLRFVCFDVVNMVVKTVNEMNMSELSGDIEEIMEFTTLDELENKLGKLLVKICASIDQYKQNKNVELGKKILEYINENYLDGNLSLEAISQKFNFSIYYLSRFFKEQTGDNFTDYLTNLRLDKAKKMLTYSDRPIKDIVTDIGYVDVPSFVRKFKKLEGITPGKYRELHTKIKE